MLPPIKEFPITQIITAIGALGTAAFGIVDAAKSGMSSINRIGLAHITRTIEHLTPEPDGVNSLERRHILKSVEANWINGQDLSRQKCAAVTLILGHMIRSNADGLAARTNIDPATLESIAAKTISGATLLPEESAVQTRFELILNTLIDEAYQRSDQLYRNGTRSLAAIVAVALALAGGWVIEGCNFWQLDHFAAALFVGLIATPMAPIAKDLSTTVAAFADTLQAPKTAAAPAAATGSGSQAAKQPAAAADVHQGAQTSTPAADPGAGGRAD